MRKNRTQTYIFLFQLFLASAGMFIGFMENSPFPFLVFLVPCVFYHISTTEQKKRRLLLKIFIISIITSTINLYWVAYPIMEIGRLPFLSAYSVVVLISLVLSLFPLLFGYLVSYSYKTFAFLITKLIFAGLLWTICEYFQSFLFSGFPWLSLTPALAQWLPTAIPVSVFGSYLYSGILVIFFCSIYESIRSRSIIIILFSTTILVTLSIMSYFLYTAEPEDGLPLNVALIQGNIEQTSKWDDEMEEIILTKYINLTKQAIHSSKTPPNNFDLILWPETALPFLLSPKAPLTQELSSFIKNIETPLLTGSIRYGGNAENRKRLIFNSALLFTENGILRSWYDKEKLVPLGEYTPLVFDAFVDILNVQRGGQFTAGQNNFLLSVKNIPFGVLICYEIIFPRYAQEQVKEGANFLVTISNDAWFGHTRAAWQHLQHARLRAIELSRFLLRATNTGITAVISPQGKVLQQTQLFEDTFITATIETQNNNTIYTIIAPYILLSVIILAFLLFIFRAPSFSMKQKKTLIRREI